MRSALLKIGLLIWLMSLCPAVQGQTAEESHILVSLRMIGHKLLLEGGDSLSRVLPVQKVGDAYRVSFESEFPFEPDELVGLVDSLVRETKLADDYLVEVQHCETNQIVYSYEIINTGKSDLIPCKGRTQPKACYSLLFTILKPTGKGIIAGNTWTFSALTLLVLGGLVFYMRNRDAKPEIEKYKITLGTFIFDSRKQVLSHQGTDTELTSKESDLLLLLCKHINETVERDRLLQQVWGDSGDYIGRTLDVYISKLRKKLEADRQLEILNVRGIGYKLILNG